MSQPKKIELSFLPGSYSICKLPSNRPVPSWIYTESFFSITRTESELSLVCLKKSVPDHYQAEHEWKIIKVRGPLDFLETGIISALAKPLAEASIPIFTISTYETDYILVKEKHTTTIMEILKSNNFIFK